jgi:hypothetical protein
MDGNEKDAISKLVEEFLRTDGGWIPARVICDKFGIHERLLRANQLEPGICTNFAISGKAGFRHVETCTPEEFEQFQLAINTHAERERDRARTLARKRELAAAWREQLARDLEMQQAVAPMEQGVLL